MSRIPLIWALSVAIILVFTTSASAFSYSWGPQELEFKVRPGQTMSRTFQVTNGTGTTTHFQTVVYDWTFEGSKNSFMPPGTLPTSGLTWLTVTPERFRLQPGEQQLVKVTVTAPPGASGARFAAIFAETLPAEQSPDGWTMGVGARLGVLAPIRVLGSGFEAAEVSTVALADDARSVSVQATNTGDVHLRPTVKIALMKDGQILGTARSRGGQRLLPGQSKSIEVPVELDLEQGAYDVLGVLIFGDGREVAFSETFTVAAR